MDLHVHMHCCCPLPFQVWCPVVSPACLGAEVCGCRQVPVPWYAYQMTVFPQSDSVGNTQILLLVNKRWFYKCHYTLAGLPMGSCLSLARVHCFPGVCVCERENDMFAMQLDSSGIWEVACLCCLWSYLVFSHLFSVFLGRHNSCLSACPVTRVSLYCPVTSQH